jgi:hypothetical protein
MCFIISYVFSSTKWENKGQNRFFLEAGEWGVGSNNVYTCE